MLFCFCFCCCFDFWHYGFDIAVKFLFVFFFLFRTFVELLLFKWCRLVISKEIQIVSRNLTCLTLEPVPPQSYTLVTHNIATISYILSFANICLTFHLSVNLYAKFTRSLPLLTFQIWQSTTIVLFLYCIMSWKIMIMMMMMVP